MLNTLKILGLKEVTSQTQANNGTVCFYDPIADCDYMSYESGYVRRKYSIKHWRTGNSISTIYQLNKTKSVQRELSWKPGKFVTCTERILESDSGSRLEMIAHAALNFRKYKNA